MASVALGTKAVGSIVKLKESGVAVNYIVVHQGKPSSIYDESATAPGSCGRTSLRTVSGMTGM